MSIQDLLQDLLFNLTLENSINTHLAQNKFATIKLHRRQRDCDVIRKVVEYTASLLKQEKVLSFIK